MRKPTFQEAARAGFVFPQGRGWIDGNVPALAQDAALVTQPNMAVPVEFTAYIDPMVIEILTAPRNAKAVFDEVKKGDWTTSYEKWRVDEVLGSTQPYTDYQSGTTSEVNSNWFSREQYVFQTTIKFGDREVDMASQAKIELASSKQKAAATIIDIDANKFYLLGVDGRNIRGILNDPNLPAESATDGWEGKPSTGIYDDILVKLYGKLAERSAGHITPSSPLKLLVSPRMSVLLGKATEFNISVMDMLNKYFTNLEVVVLPELSTAFAGERIFMICTEVNGAPTGQLAFGDKFRLMRLIPDMSSFRQKAVCTTYGGIVLQPFAYASISGMEGAWSGTPTPVTIAADTPIPISTPSPIDVRVTEDDGGNP